MGSVRACIIFVCLAASGQARTILVTGATKGTIDRRPSRSECRLLRPAPARCHANGGPGWIYHGKASVLLSPPSLPRRAIALCCTGAQMLLRPRPCGAAWQARLPGSMCASRQILPNVALLRHWYANTHPLAFSHGCVSRFVRHACRFKKQSNRSAASTCSYVTMVCTKRRR